MGEKILTPLEVKRLHASDKSRRNFFLNRIVEAFNMVPGVIKKKIKNSGQFRKCIQKTQGTWWGTPKLAQSHRSAIGETTSGSRYILRDPWVIGRKTTSITK